MKFFPFLFVLVLSKDLEKLLSSQNQELSKINANLHKQLLALSKGFSVQIQEDYFYNKQRIFSLITEYEKEADELVRIFLAEEMSEYIRGIIEDANLLGGEIEGIESKKLLKTLQELQKNTKDCKQRYYARESSGFYNDLHSVLLQKQDLVQELQAENARLYGKIESKLAEIKETKRNHENNLRRYEESSEQLKRLRSNYATQTMELEENVKKQSSRTLSKLDVEDQEILVLQAKNSENSLEIEKLSAEVSVLTSKIRILNDTSMRLQLELDTKSAELSTNHQKFEDFSDAVRSETTFQVNNIIKSEEQLQNERNDLDTKERELTQELNKCKRDMETFKSIVKAKTFMIDEDMKELKETEMRQGNASEQRKKEIEKLSQKYNELQNRIAGLQQSLDDSMRKISEKATLIQDLQSKIKNIHKDDNK